MDRLFQIPERLQLVHHRDRLVEGTEGEQSIVGVWSPQAANSCSSSSPVMTGMTKSVRITDIGMAASFASASRPFPQSPPRSRGRKPFQPDRTVRGHRHPLPGRASTYPFASHSNADLANVRSAIIRLTRFGTTRFECTVNQPQQFADFKGFFSSLGSVSGM